MSEENNEISIAEETETVVPEGSGKKKLILIVLVVLLLAGAGSAAFFYMRGTGAANVETDETAESKPAEKKPKSKKAKPAQTDEEEETEKDDSASSASKSSLKSALPNDEDVKHIIELQPFIVNLADSDQARYLRLTISVGVGGEEGGGEKADPIFITRVRNAMLAVLSVKTSDDVLSVEGKAKLRKELLKAAKAASEEPHVEAIYITDFIVQL